MATILINIGAALIGTLFGSIFLSWIQRAKLKSVRDVAIKALNIFIDYAKDDQTFHSATSEFNNKLSVVEKRAVLVAISKLGIPVRIPINEPFNIQDIKFESDVIHKNEIKLMIEQVKKGNCDSMFFADIDAYLSTNSRLFAVRSIAKKYVDIDFSMSKCNHQDKVITHPDIGLKLFIPGELNVLQVFSIRTCQEYYFDEVGNPISSKMEELKREIDIGVWDAYLFWDFESYRNIITQNQMAAQFCNVISNNGQHKADTVKQ